MRTSVSPCLKLLHPSSVMLPTSHVPRRSAPGVIPRHFVEFAAGHRYFISCVDKVLNDLLQAHVERPRLGAYTRSHCSST